MPAPSPYSKGREETLAMLRGIVYITGLWVIVFKTDVVLTLIILAGKQLAQP